MTWLAVRVAFVGSVVAICVGFASHAYQAYRAIDDDAASPPNVPVAAHRLPPPPPQHQPDPSIISVRNIFCSTCEPAIATAASYSGMPIVLIATSQTTATVRVVPTEAQGAWGVDETIPGVGRILRIDPAAIEVIDDAGHSKVISMLESPSTPGAGGAATPPVAGVDPLTDRVKKLADNSFEVDRELVRELVAAGGRNTGVRAMPVVTNNEVTGLRFSGVRAGSLGAAIGLRNGDVIASIDGVAIKTMQQLLDFYGRLDDLKAIELQGTRGGKPLAIQLKFR